MSTTPDAVQPGESPATDDPAPGEASGSATLPRPETEPGPRSGDPSTVSPARRRRLLRTIAVLAVAVLAIDQATKAWAVAALTEGERTDVLGQLLGVTLLYNPGAALSIATGMTWVLTVVAVVVVVVTIRASRRIGSRGWAVALGLLLGGAVGNLVDRFLREPGPARGHVVDFIAYADWFVGNVADIAIVGAAGLIMLLASRGIGMDGTRQHASRGQHRYDPHDPDDAPATHRAADDRWGGGGLGG